MKPNASDVTQRNGRRESLSTTCGVHGVRGDWSDATGVRGAAFLREGRQVNSWSPRDASQQPEAALRKTRRVRGARGVVGEEEEEHDDARGRGWAASCP